jgi:hypothetical protein
MTVDVDGVVVGELDDDFDELPQAATRTAPTVMTIAAPRLPLCAALLLAPISGIFTSVSCRMNRGRGGFHTRSRWLNALAGYGGTNHVRE